MRLSGAVSCFTLVAALLRPSSAAAADLNTYPVSVSRNNDQAGFGFSHATMTEYTATLYVNGVAYQVILDTGSSDTWIDPLSAGVTMPPNLVPTGLNSSTAYVDGTVSTGPIVLADLDLGPYTVQHQAIMISYNGSPNPQLYNGLLGLGGTVGSTIYSALQNTSYVDNGIPVIYNIFKNQPDLPNYMTWLMSRSEIGINDGGVLTISEVLSNMTDIVSAPVFPSPFPSRWISVMDGIYVNGKLVTAHTNVSAGTLSKFSVSVPENSVLAAFDTGTSLVQGPVAFTDAIYKNIPGAQLVPDDAGLVGPGQTAYFVPCNTKLNITFSFGGHLYPMHPVDAIDVLQYPNGSFACFGTIMGGPTSNPVDMILGAMFLHNAYQLYDYGTLDSPSSRPSTRLLSTTDEGQAWAEADSLNLARILAYQSNWQASVAAASVTVSATERPVYTGTVGAVSLTSVADNVSSMLAAPPTSVSGISATTSTLDASPTIVAGAGDDSVRIAGAVSEDDTNTTSKTVDLSTLKTNSYVILGLLVAVLMMLVVVTALLVKVNQANKGYRAVPSGNLARQGKAFDANEESYYATPYDERS